MRTPLVILALAVAAVAVPANAAQHTTTVVTATTVTCKTVNAKYRHGVGRPGAHDKTKSKKGPVTNFTRNKTVYLKYKRLDRDRDGIACEKR